MKNVLIAVDWWRYGGTERHIRSYYEQLHGKELNYVLATIDMGKHENDPFVRDNPVYSGFVRARTVGELVDNVERLCEIIERHRIDIIHIHSHYMFIPSLLAAAKTGKCVILTMHGLYMNTYFKECNRQLLLRYAITDLQIPVTSTHPKFGRVIQTEYFSNNVFFLPNAMDPDTFNGRYSRNGKWLVISRLSREKLAEIKLVIDNLEQLHIEQLYIAGVGPDEDDIFRYVEGHPFKDRIRFMGYVEDVPGELASGYQGVIGIGQAVMEGLFAQIPVLLIGNGKISGLVDRAVYEQIKYRNFANRTVARRTVEEVGNQILSMNDSVEEYRIPDIRTEFNVQKCSEDYLRILSGMTAEDWPLLCEFYQSLRELDDPNLLFDGRQVFALIRDKIVAHSPYTSLQKLANDQEAIYRMQDSIEKLQKAVKRSRKTIKSYEAKVEEQKTLIRSLEKNQANTGLRTILKNTMKHIKSKSK